MPWRNRPVVVHRRPGQQWLIRIGVVLLLLLSTWLAYQLGRSLGGRNETFLSLRSGALETLLGERDASVEQLQQELANLRIGAELDREAVQQMRRALREHRDTIAELTEEITFYRGLMAPELREQGLSLREPELQRLPSGRTAYRLVVQQLALHHELLQGQLQVFVEGVQGDERLRLPLEQISAPAEAGPIRLRFKYFQAIEGELHLPEGFVAEHWVLQAQASRPRPQQLERQFVWRLELDEELE